mgnify:CR=1 FL=1
MKKTFSGLISTAQDGASDTSSAIKTFLKRRINERYELVTDKLNTWTQSYARTFTTGTAAGADQQYYYNPPNLREIESIVLAISSTKYNLVPVYAQEEWDDLNAQTVATGYPQRYFRRANDFGIWPTPNEDDYTGTINFTQRATPLYFEDYITGTVVATENDQTLTFTTGVTTTFKAGFWFTLTDSTGEPRGSWYRIASITDSANVELETYFEEATDSGATYIVGQVPEIPEETIPLLAIGAVSDFYALKQKDLESATKFDNKFWSGNFNVTALQAKKDKDYGGLLAAIDAYADRDGSVFVTRTPSERDIFDIRNPRVATLT